MKYSGRFLFVVIFSLFLGSAPPVFGQPVDRKEMDLRGRVRTLREDRITFTETERGWKQNPPYLGLRASFSPEGRLLELEEYTSDKQEIYSWEFIPRKSGESTITILPNQEMTTLDTEGRIMERRRSLYGTTQKWTYRYDAGGSLVNGQFHNSQSKGTTGWSITHDAKSGKREIRQTGPDGRIHSVRTTEFYREKPVAETAVYYGEDGKERSAWEYHYDKSGRVIEEIFRYGAPDFSSSWVTEGEANGPVSRENRIGSARTWGRKTYSYDTDGRIVSTEEYNSTGTRIRKTVMGYTHFGDPAAQASFTDSGSLISRTTYTYQYDVRGNWTRRETRTDNNAGEKYNLPQGVLIRSIEYFD